MELLGLKTLLRANKCVTEPLLCGRCVELPKTTADLVNMMEVGTHSEAFSNSRRMTEEVTQNFSDGSKVRPNYFISMRYLRKMRLQ